MSNNFTTVLHTAFWNICIKQSKKQTSQFQKLNSLIKVDFCVNHMLRYKYVLRI
jgi:hypothetical protein